jgi:hypothetical protein
LDKNYPLTHLKSFKCVIAHTFYGTVKADGRI